ncbi:MAG: prolyl oligopeptidase family serine peptidase [Candidatus Nanopelagicales bacterium]|nr:prolyl oligopeptidase family serine peptidase [Candidatus Nanopelagicales bacterium]MCF8550992.1 prolyl oligopeptidase family serine peptidase [Candidatus Nanopelagicales bacterium]
MTESFPRQKALTRSFRLGAPRGFQVNAQRQIVIFIRSESGRSPAGDLWCAQPAEEKASAWIERRLVDSATLATGDIPEQERARRERMREVTEGITAFSADHNFSRATFVLNGELYVVDIPADASATISAPVPIATGGGCVDPRISPDGSRVAYIRNNGVYLADCATGECAPLVEPDPSESTVSWGLADFAAAEELERIRGYWWNPDSQSLLIERVDESAVEIAWISDPAHPQQPAREHRYPFAGTPNADVRLVHVDLNGKQQDMEWDREAFPYLVTVTTSGSSPTFSVMSRDQQRVQINALNGHQVRELALRTDLPWYTVFPGVPCLNDSGQLVEIRPIGNSFRLCLDGEPISPEALQVDSLLQANEPLVYTGSTDPTATEIVVHTATEIVVHTATEITPFPGVHSAVVDTPLAVVASARLDSTRTVYRLIDIRDPEITLHEFASHAETPVITPRVSLELTGPHALRSAIIWPENHVPGTKIPVICAPYGGPHAQRVLHAGIAYCSDQWLANQGFAVVITDNRGTPSRGPEFEYSIDTNIAEVIVQDQIAALTELSERFPDLDLDRVGIHGWSFGGYLAALAVLVRPDFFHAAIAGAPVTDWALYDTAYSERYLGTPQNNPGKYEAASLLNKASGLGSPLLIIHGLSDDNVLAAHTLQLSSALLEAGKDHAVLPLTGVTHMTPQEVVAENLLLTELRFFQEHLGNVR